MKTLSLTNYKHIRFLGAEGIGMSALIRIIEEAKTLGTLPTDLKISKSDIAYKQNDELSDDIDLVVRSTAIKDSDPEIQELRARGVELWHRSDMLNALSSNYKQLVCTGTHGKTTTSAMMAFALKQLSDCSFAIGGILADFDSNGGAGNSEYFVLEGDESDKSFTKTNPYLALVTSVEPDHLENYPGGLEEIRQCFFDFLDRAEHKVICIDDGNLANYLSSQGDCFASLAMTQTPLSSQDSTPSLRGKAEAISYSSTNNRADFYIDTKDGTLKHQGQEFKLKLKMPGIHNLINATGVIAALYSLGLEVQACVDTLAGFSGIKRRFELINSNYDGITIYDDYAHHPTEVKALALSALNMLGRDFKRLVFVYQPHHPERTKQLWNDFVTCFQELCDDTEAEMKILLADIYVARSQPIEGISSERLATEINRPQLQYLAPSSRDILAQSESGKGLVGNFADIVGSLKPAIDAELQEGDLLFVVGAGNIAKVAAAYSS